MFKYIPVIITLFLMGCGQTVNETTPRPEEKTQRNYFAVDYKDSLAEARKYAKRVRDRHDSK